MDIALLLLRLLLAAVFLMAGLALLIGMGWLLWHVLRQQGRLLLRIEATAARLAEVGLAPLGEHGGRSVAGLAVGTPAPGGRRPDRDGTPGSPLAQGADAIGGLVEAAMGQQMRSSVPMAGTASHNNGSGATVVPGPPAVPRIGELAPEFSLPDLSGNLVQLSDFQGAPTLVLFWGPSCGFCQRMLPHLLAWEAWPPEGAPGLLVVSTGSVVDNQTLGLRSPVVLDQAGRSIGSRFGATGTPTAVLVDAEGRIASELAAGAPAIFALAMTQPTQAEGSIELTIGMATYNDFDGVYFTLQALRLYQDLQQTELLVIDNYGCEHTQQLVEALPGARYIRATDVVGTAAPRDLIFREARGKAVLCCDCHVLFAPGVIAQLKQYYREHPVCQDLLQGPLLYDDGKLIATHFDPVWREQMWGTWGSDPKGQDPSGAPFEIPMQGLGVFSCLKSAWLGFHPQFRGFGGEEGYIHEKFRQAGRRCLCLPWLRWMHRFSRPSGVKYPLAVEDKLHNYVIGHTELGLDLVPLLRHFAEHLPQDRVLAVAEQALGGQWVGFSSLFEKDVCVILNTSALPGRGEVSRVSERAPDFTLFPLVSVVLPVYNGERYIRAAVQSLLGQTFQQFEIIIINDGSTDQTEQILGELAADPRVRPVHQRHLGIPQARNRGMDLAKAKYIAIHDADDLSLPDRLAKQYKFLEKFPDFGAVGSLVGRIDETGRIMGAFGGEVTDPGQVAVKLSRYNCMIHGSVMMRKQACEGVGKYREVFALAHDYDLWLRMVEHTQLANLAEVLYLYRDHAESVSLTHRKVQDEYAFIALKLAEERRQTGSDLLEREGSPAFQNTYGTRLREASLAIEAHQDAVGQAQPAGSRLGLPASTPRPVNGSGKSFQLQLASPRQKVFGIGLSKTGTSSLTEALELLGYQTAHGPADPKTREELYRFFATGLEYIHLSVLNTYDALTDAAVCCLYQALDKGYPDSKFILTVREKHAWLRSYQCQWEKSVHFQGPKSDEPLAHYTRFLNEKLFGHPGRNEATEEILSPAYDRYTSEVLEYFKERPHDLLILDICGGEGWSKLAPFLEVPFPKTPFPWENVGGNHEEGKLYLSNVQ